MKCVVCKKGETKAGTTTMTLERDGARWYSRASQRECAPTVVKRM